MGGGSVKEGFWPRGWSAGVNEGWVAARVQSLVWCGLCVGGGVLCSGPDQSLGWMMVRGRVAMIASMDGEESALE